MEQVIQSYPISDARLWENPYGPLLILFILITVISMLLIEVYKTERKKRVIFNTSMILGCLCLVTNIFLMNLSFYNKGNKLAEQRSNWEEKIYKPYVENLEEVKVPVFQSRWNKNGNIDVILDTNKYKDKIITEIKDFIFYESADPTDKGYIIIKDFVGKPDIPEGDEYALLRESFESEYKLKYVYLSKQHIESEPQTE